ncbi:MAG: hypothetical protein H0W30_19485 [Gemmatimonadaceae bacterium]|nr:hypothetical protein [Gemmatimonadaceae bacterium]
MMAFRTSRIDLRRRSRRGAVLVMVALLLTALLGFGAFAVDLTQVMAHRSELQRSADAAALAGVVKLMSVRPDSAYAEAVRYIALNTVMGDTAGFTVEYGRWSGTSFTVHPCSPNCGRDGAYENDAIRVSLTSTSPSIFARVNSTAVRAEAVAWVSPNVEVTDCVKPFAIPYQALTATIDKRTGTPGNLNRPLTQADLVEIRSNAIFLKFCLKEGEVCAAADTILGQYPSSFLVVNLGGGQGNVQQNIENCVPRRLGPDSVLTVFSGSQPYFSDVDMGRSTWCRQFGSLPCAMKVVLYDLSAPSAPSCVAGVTGTEQCLIYRVASIVITGVRSGVSSNPLLPSPVILDGHFAAAVDHGNVGCTFVQPNCPPAQIRRTTLMRPILVQ